MQILNLCLGIATMFAPLFLFQALLLFHDRKETKSPVEVLADPKPAMAQA